MLGEGLALGQAGSWSALCFRQMDVIKMIEELRTEREQIEEAILVLYTYCAWTRSSSRASARLDDRNKAARPSTWQQEQAQGRRCSLSGLPLNQSR